MRNHGRRPTVLSSAGCSGARLGCCPRAGRHHWADAEVVRVTARNVIVRYDGATARLDRQQLWYCWAFWRGVRFVSSQTGRIADALDEAWRRRFARADETLPPSMRMPLAEAIALLHVPADYSKTDVLAAFRREAKKAHPDAGGTAEMFRRLVEARDRLLSALGTSAPPPKPPSYTPSGYVTRYVRLSSSSRRIGSSTRLIR